LSIFSGACAFIVFSLLFVVGIQSFVPKPSGAKSEDGASDENAPSNAADAGDGSVVSDNEQPQPISEQSPNPSQQQTNEEITSNAPSSIPDNTSVASASSIPDNSSIPDSSSVAESNNSI
jgi:hypothetical protein